MINYDDYRHNFKTGDVISFSGNSKFSKVIKWKTGSEFSHCGIVVLVPEFDIVTILESTSLNKKILDVEDNVPKNGIQFNSLSERFKQYDGEVYVQHLNMPLVAGDIKSLIEFKKKIKNRPYEQNKWELIRSSIEILGDNFKEDLSSLFCSETVAECFQKMDLLSEDKSSNSYTPKEITEMKLLRGYKLEEIVRLK